MANKNGIVNQLNKTIAENLGPLAKEMHMPTAEMEAQKIAQEMQRDIDSFTTRCQEGARLCIGAVEELAAKDRNINISSIKENLIKGTEKIDTKEKAEHFGLQLANGKSWKELLGLHEKTVQSLYHGASEIYNSKRYKEAVAAFTFLTTLDAKEYAFWVGLGNASLHANEVPRAINAYAMATMCDETAYWPHIYAANAFEASKDSENALKALEEAKRLYDKQKKKDPEVEPALSNRIAALKRNS